MVGFMKAPGQSRSGDYHVLAFQTLRGNNRGRRDKAEGFSDVTRVYEKKKYSLLVVAGLVYSEQV